MKIRGLFVVFMILTLGLSAQTFNQKVKDDKLNKEVLVGYCDSTGLNQDIFGQYFKTQKETYKPKSSFISKINSFTKNGDYEFVVIFGDWCSDSKLQVGRFDKILDELTIPIDKKKFIAVDRSKSGRQVDVKKYRLQYVPTFIVYKGGLEIGRIVESPDRTLEKDLYNILKNNK